MSALINTNMLNFYQQLPAQYRDKNKKYKNYNQIKIDVPMRMVIVGASGSGKTK
jgi:ABC-type lipoprotein export system ATPase subunit